MGLRGRWRGWGPFRGAAVDPEAWIPMIPALDSASSVRRAPHGAPSDPPRALLVQVTARPASNPEAAAPSEGQGTGRPQGVERGSLKTG